MTSDTISALLLASNKSHMRPLECAVNNGVLGLAMAFLLTKGPYIIHEENGGLVTYQWIDVTEYEGYGKYSRRELSPLSLLTLMDKNRLNYPHTTAFFSDPTILKWIKIKTRCGALPAICCLLMRAILIGLFMAIDTDVGCIDASIVGNNNNTNINNNISNNNNNSSGNNKDSTICTDFSQVHLSHFTRNVICCLLVFQTVISLCMDLIEYIISFRPHHVLLLKNMNNKHKNIFLHYQGYRFAHFVITITIFLRALASLIGTNDPRDNLISYSRIVTGACIWWSFTYFLQLMPGANFFVIAIQNMTEKLMQFYLLSCVCLILFTQLFMVTINFNMKHGCAAQFGDLFTSIYSTLLALSNLMDFTQFDITSPFQLYVIHVIFVIVVQILLLNFLIAIMCDRITVTRERKNVILPIQELSVVLTIEKQLIFGGQWYYKWLQKKLFTMYNGRLCIVRMVLNHGDQPSAINY